MILMVIWKNWILNHLELNVSEDDKVLTTTRMSFEHVAEWINQNVSTSAMICNLVKHSLPQAPVIKLYDIICGHHFWSTTTIVDLCFVASCLQAIICCQCYVTHTNVAVTDFMTQTDDTCTCVGIIVSIVSSTHHYVHVEVSSVRDYQSLCQDVTSHRLQLLILPVSITIYI